MLQLRTGWVMVQCRCGRREEVQRRSICARTGRCSRCYCIAEGMMDADGNWLGKYAKQDGDGVEHEE